MRLDKGFEIQRFKSDQINCQILKILERLRGPRQCLFRDALLEIVLVVCQCSIHVPRKRGELR
jgi:hypothetical protein